MTQPPKGQDQYTAQTFIDAIPGTGGVKSAIARKVGCVYNTVQKYIDKYPTVRQAYEDECARVLDLAVSVVVQNINLAAKLQADTGLPVDVSDAKWFLSRKGKEQGWSERTEVTGASGGPVGVSIIEVVKSSGVPD